MKTSRGADEQKAFLFLRFKDFSRYYYITAENLIVTTVST